jgi:putative peptide zinc metalloprotease protein
MLPELRDDLMLYPGPSNTAGQPSWTIHDIARNRFFRVDWLTFEIIGRWSFGEPQAIADNVNAHTTLHATTDDVRDVSKFLIDNELIRASFPGSAAFLADRLKQRKKSWAQWLLHHYLFIRIPLVKPDAFLERNLRYVAVLTSPVFLRLTLVMLLFGLWQMFRQSDLVASTFIDQLNPAGFFSYMAALIGVKIVHELGHGFVSKHHGCRVPTMGVALLVLWPVAYTDTTETWKLDDKYKRLHVACAGVATELTIAAWASALWALLPDGALRDVAFVLATTTWISTLLVNFNPLMRFDGYFILSDWLDIPNLHDRAFALARWQLRRMLLGVADAPPEVLPAKTKRFLVGLAWVTWIYRLALYIGIALLVYHFFIKLVGILLFVVEMWWFILKPVTRELSSWWARRAEWQENRRARRAALIAGALLLLLFAPLPTRVRATAILSPEQLSKIYAPEPGRLVERRANGATVEAGETVAVIDSPAVDKDREVLEAKVEMLRRQVASAPFDDKLRPQLLILQSDLAAAEAAMTSVSRQQGRLALASPMTGRLVDVDPDTGVGDWVGKGMQIATVVGEGAWRATAYLTEAEARQVSVGDRAMFFPGGQAHQSVELVVASVDADSTRSLPDGRFASHAGGDVSVRNAAGRLVPEKAVYRVTLRADEVPSGVSMQSWRGQAVIRGDWSSLGVRYVQAALAVVVREAGF